jgi:uncharacterized protein YjbI with pentapeptide repeats
VTREFARHGGGEYEGVPLSDEKQSMRAWFGFAEPFDWRKRSYLGPLLSVLGIIVVGGLFILAIVAAFKLLGSAVFGGLPQGAGASFGLTGIIVAMIGAPFVVWRAMVAHKQANTAENLLELQRAGLFEDRLGKALGNMSARYGFKGVGRNIRFTTQSDNSFEWYSTKRRSITEKDIQATEWATFEETRVDIESRVAGINQMEGLAKEYPQARARVTSLLNGYLNQNSPSKTASQSPQRYYEEISKGASSEQQVYDHYGVWPNIEEKDEMYEWLEKLMMREDLQLALQTIGRLGRLFKDRAFINQSLEIQTSETIGIVLANTNLQASRLQNVDFVRADFSGSSFEGAGIDDSFFDCCNFSQALFDGSEINSVSFKGCKFDNAELVLVRWKAANLQRASMKGCIVTQSTFVKIDFSFANLSYARFNNTRVSQTSFRGAQLINTEFKYIFFDNCSFEDCPTFKFAEFQKVGLFNIDLRNVDVNQDQIAQCFGDQTVLLPSDIQRPINWPDWPLGPDLAYHEYYKWRSHKSPLDYVPPKNPT